MSTAVSLSDAGASLEWTVQMVLPHWLCHRQHCHCRRSADDRGVAFARHPNAATLILSTLSRSVKQV